MPGRLSAVGVTKLQKSLTVIARRPICWESFSSLGHTVGDCLAKVTAADQGLDASVVGIAIPGSRDSRIPGKFPGSRDSGMPGSRKFSNPEIPGLSRTQSRDFGINKIYLFNGLFSTFKNNIVHFLIL